MIKWLCTTHKQQIHKAVTHCNKEAQIHNVRKDGEHEYLCYECAREREYGNTERRPVQV